MCEFTNQQLDSLIEFQKKYMQSVNAATGSEIDPNANVNVKNIATLDPELSKPLKAQMNRRRLYLQIKEDWGIEQADKYLWYLNHKLLYKHDETSIYPYCVALNSYNFLKYGTTKLGGSSGAPTHLDSYCGAFVNYIYATSAQFAGAVATPDFLMQFDYFARLDYGDNYLVEHRSEIENHLQTVIYGINHPAGNRGYQSVFWNISMFDKYYFAGLFNAETDKNGNKIGGFKFPAAKDGDGSMYISLIKRAMRQSGLSDDEIFEYCNTLRHGNELPEEVENKIKDAKEMWLNRQESLRVPSYESLFKLQVFFLKWFHNEKLRSRQELTFPVLTLAMQNENGKMKDQEFAKMAAYRLSKGDSFFIYNDEDVSSLSSCCRLRNSISKEEKAEFSYSLGAGGLATGSLSVMTINFNRLIQKRYPLETIVKDIHKFQVSYRHIIDEFFKSGMLTVYNAGLISLNRQFLTLGINGMLEAAEYLGMEPTNNDEYKNWLASQLKVIFDLNKEATKTYGMKFNTEFVPAEGLGVKNADWDRADGLFVPRDCYNSYFFRSEDEKLSPIDKLEMHGKQVTQYLDGGSACHINLEEHATQEAYMNLFNVAAAVGCNYFTINVRGTRCHDCGFRSHDTLYSCPECGSKNIAHITRVIGYHKEVPAYSFKRQIEARNRAYSKL